MGLDPLESVAGTKRALFTGAGEKVLEEPAYGWNGRRPLSMRRAVADPIPTSH